MQGAGGSSGGVGEFLIGFVMMCGGFYMLLSRIIVKSSFHLGTGLYHFNIGSNRVPINSGMVLIPLIFGIGMIFYNSKSRAGWLISIGSLAALIFGVISSLEVTMRAMSAFDIIVILVLAFGGLGLFLKSLKAH